jgi:hypothetical protein
VSNPVISSAGSQSYWRQQQVNTSALQSLGLNTPAAWTVDSTCASSPARTSDAHSRGVAQDFLNSRRRRQPGDLAPHLAKLMATHNGLMADWRQLSSTLKRGKREVLSKSWVACH